MTSLKINIPCQQIDPQRRAMISALQTQIATKSWHAKYADRQGRHVDAETYRREKESLQRQLAALQ